VTHFDLVVRPLIGVVQALRGSIDDSWEGKGNLGQNCLPRTVVDDL